MVIVLSELATGSTPLVFELAVTSDRFDLDGPARFEGAIVVSDRLELEGRVAARLGLECSRCLEPFAWPVDVPLELRIVGDGAESGPPEGEMRADDAMLLHAKGGALDLAEVVREFLELEVPLKAVCSAGCRGLCPACGENRNRIECGCQTDVVDPRLAPLLDLRRRSRS